MAGCELDFSSLPILTGCPGANETFLVGNAVGGLDVNGMPTIGYARRAWSDIQACAAAGLTFVAQQFIVGSVGSINPGNTTATINQANVIQDSVQVVLNGVVLDRNDANQISYTVAYNVGNFVVTFNQGAMTGQIYIITYAHS